MLKLTPTPGLLQVQPNVPPAYAAKITGRNLGAITYMVSLSCEAHGEQSEVYIRFNTDGSLNTVTVDGQDVKPGNFLILANKFKALAVATPEAFENDWTIKR